MSAPTISVVIPALNAASTLSEQMAALAEQTYDEPWEVLVVDNGSVDDTAAIALRSDRHSGADIRVVNEPRRGLNVARNAGVRLASAPVIAICDADDVVGSGWLAAMVRGLSTWDVVGGALEFGLLNADSVRTMRGIAGGATLVPSVGRGLHFLPQVLCGNVAFRKEVWERVGGFDEAFSHGGDDVDFGWRAQIAGFTVGYSSEAVLHYRLRADRHALFQQHVRDGMGSAHLYAVYQSAGMPRRSTGEAVRRWLWLARRFWWLHWGSPQQQGQFVRVAGKQWGRVRGSVRHRVVFP